MTVHGGLEFADAPEQVLLPLAVALLECLVAPAMLGLYLRVAAAVGCEDLARLPGFLGGRLPVEFLAGYPVDVGEVPAPGGSGTPGDLHLAEVLEMLNGHLDRGDAAGVDGVGDLPVGPLGQPVVIAEVGQRDVDGPGGDVQAGTAVEGVPDHVVRARGNGRSLPLILLRRRWNWGKLG